MSSVGTKKRTPARAILVPHTRDLYERDLYAWVQHQVAALREGRTADLDLENLAEEIDDVGKEQSSKLESALRLITMHMLKWDQQGTHRSRSWVLTILRERLTCRDVLDDNPSLGPRREGALRRAYGKARLEAAQETGLPLRVFPPECPYSLDEVLDRPFEWPEA